MMMPKAWNISTALIKYHHLMVVCNKPKAREEKVYGYYAGLIIKGIAAVRVGFVLSST